MSVTVRPFGSISTGEEVKAYTITNDGGASCTLLDYGATIQAIRHQSYQNEKRAPEKVPFHR